MAINQTVAELRLLAVVAAEKEFKRQQRLGLKIMYSSFAAMVTMVFIVSLLAVYH